MYLYVHVVLFPKKIRTDMSAHWFFNICNALLNYRKRFGCYVDAFSPLLFYERLKKSCSYSYLRRDPRWKETQRVAQLPAVLIERTFSGKIDMRWEHLRRPVILETSLYIDATMEIVFKWCDDWFLLIGFLLLTLFISISPSDFTR